LKKDCTITIWGGRQEAAAGSRRQEAVSRRQLAGSSWQEAVGRRQWQKTRNQKPETKR